MKLEEYGYAMNDASEHSLPNPTQHMIIWSSSLLSRSSNPDRPNIRKSLFPVSFPPYHTRQFDLLACRRGTCYLQILKYQAAIADFKKVIKLEPKNADVKTQLAATQKLVRKIEFEKVCIIC